MSPAPGRDTKLNDVVVTGVVKMTGVHTTFTIDPAMLGVYDYTLTGGRLGGVLGEDAIELSQGAANCNKDCQAQNQIQGSLPFPPDPSNPTPIGG